MADNSHRWSELVPPHTALTFAALWDPEDGMVTFSGGRLLESDIQSILHFPRDAHDGQSTILTFDGLSLPFSSSVFGTGRRPRVPTVTFAYNALDDAQSTVDPFFCSATTSPTSSAQRPPPSSHFDWCQFRSVGRAIYSIYSVACAPLERGVLRLSRPITDDTDSCSSDGDFFEDAPPPTAGTFSTVPVLVNLNLKSTFSMTTTSTTGYVDIDTPSVYSYATTVAGATPSEAWSTLQGLDFESCSNRPAERGKRLQKPRRGTHLLIPADPAEVLARPTYNHVSDVTTDEQAMRPCLRRFKSLPKLPRISTPTAPKCSISPTTNSPWAGLPETPPPVPSHPSPSHSPHSTPPSSFPGCTPPSPSRSAGRGQPPQLRRQKSMAKVVIESVGRLTSKCRSVKLHGEV